MFVCFMTFFKWDIYKININNNNTYSTSTFYVQPQLHWMRDDCCSPPAAAAAYSVKYSRIVHVNLV
jgi:hypothetical protein